MIYTVSQTCKKLGISRVTLWKWEKEGYIMRVSYGKGVRFKKEDVDKILKEGTK